MADPTYQSIGAVSPDLDAVHHPAWDGLAGDPAPTTTPIEQAQSTTFSRWDARANRQTLGASDEGNFAHDFLQNDGDADNQPVAGYAGTAWNQPPTAATDPGHFRSAPDGTIPGAQTAQELSGNTGTQN